MNIIEAKQDVDGSPMGPASVCIEVAPNSRCYTAPKAFGKNPAVTIVRLTADQTAILFSAESSGVSGWSIHLAVLKLSEKALENLLVPLDLRISNQSQHAFWDLPTLSRSYLFLTADYVWRADEGHYGAHRFIISVYSRKEPSYRDDLDDSYYLIDQYMTARKYDLDANPNLDLLASEKSEIIARIARAKSEELKDRIRQ